MSQSPSAVTPASQGAGAASVPGRTLGIVSLIGSIVLAGLSLVWLILGIVALRQSKRAGRKNGPALAAVIIAAIALVASVILAIVLIAAAGNLASFCATNGPGVYDNGGVSVTCS